jgi:tyrosinase
MMAIEQAIGDIATVLAAKIAEQYPNEGDSWTEAARELRFP